MIKKTGLSIRTLSAIGVFSCIMLFATVTFLIVTNEAKKNLLVEFDALLVNYSLDLRQNFIKGHNYSLFNPEEEGSLEDKIFPFPHGKALIELVDLDGLVIAKSASLYTQTLPDSEEMSLDLKKISFASFFIIDESNQKKHYRMTRIPIESESEDVLGTLWVAVPTEFMDIQQKKMSQKLLFLFPPFILISLLVSYFISQVINSAILKLSSEVKSVKIDLKHVSLNVPQSPREIHDLAAAFNHLILELKKANKWQEEFFMNAAHQLKTPLFIIKNEIDELEQNDSVKFFENKNKISRRLQNLSVVLQKLLDFGRADHRISNDQMGKGYLVDIVTEVMLKLNSLADKKSIHLKLGQIQIDEFEFFGELTLIEQAIQNVLDNAIKWSPQKTAIVIDVGQEIKNEIEYFFVKIKDDGPGVHEELIDKIFLPFTGVETAESTGLGLALVKRVAQLHGGDIIYSRENNKTVFKFYFTKKRNG